jgi:hypothetical protein
VVITRSTSRPRGAIPVLGSIRSKRWVVDGPGGQVGECAGPLVLELDQRRATRAGRHRRVATAERQQLGLLVGADDVFIRAQPLALEHPPLEVERAAGLAG